MRCLIAASLLLIFCGVSAIRLDPTNEMKSNALGKKHPFISPSNIFIQERASKQLPGPGQHFSFGALTSWEEIHTILDSTPDMKLLLLVRHGQAMSNWLSDTLGPDEWFKVEETCSYSDDAGLIPGGNKTYGVFDAELTDMGQSEARALNAMLDNAKWWPKLTNGKKTEAVVSPLSRCLQTAALISDGLPIDAFHVEENVRETLGEDTCDARRSASDPDPQHPARLEGPCPFEQGLRSKFPSFSFPVVNDSYRGFGLISDKDILWTKDRETQKQQTRRATGFLYDVFSFCQSKVVMVVTHSGFTRSILLSVGREPYRPQNTELVPVLVQKVQRRMGEEQEEQDEEYEEAYERHRPTRYDYDYRQ